jgi:hypothetical protein
VRITTTGSRGGPSAEGSSDLGMAVAAQLECGCTKRGGPAQFEELSCGPSDTCCTRGLLSTESDTKTSSSSTDSQSTSSTESD